MSSLFAQMEKLQSTLLRTTLLTKTTPRSQNLKSICLPNLFRERAKHRLKPQSPILPIRLSWTTRLKIQFPLPPLQTPLLPPQIACTHAKVIRRIPRRRFPQQKLVANGAGKRSTPAMPRTKKPSVAFLKNPSMTASPHQLLPPKPQPCSMKCKRPSTTIEAQKSRCWTLPLALMKRRPTCGQGDTTEPQLPKPLDLKPTTPHT